MALPFVGAIVSAAAGAIGTEAVTRGVDAVGGAIRRRRETAADLFRRRRAYIGGPAGRAPAQVPTPRAVLTPALDIRGAAPVTATTSSALSGPRLARQLVERARRG
jgi:hypothetical protein